METNTQSNTPSNSRLSNNTEGTLNKASSSVYNSMNSIADEASRSVKPTIDQGAAMAHQAVDKAAGAAAQASGWLAQHSESLNATQKKLLEDSCSYVSANPIKSIGLALAAGFLLSRILR
jgi:ElaB/YqjD/DUF883 family membrane-anchored ribosome-binding protein